MKKVYSERSRRGFTLIELLVVIAILAVLAAGVVIAINPAKRIKQANDTKLKNDLGQVATAMQSFYTLNQYYPADVASLVTSGDLKVAPKVPPAGTADYTVARTADPACTVAPYNGCEVAVSAALNDPLVTGNVWCWRSAVGTVVETTVALCVP